MFGTGPPTMKAEHVRREMNIQRIKRDAVFDKILSAVHKSIMTKANVGSTRTEFDVPLVVPGMPVIRMHDCVGYLMSSLQADGYIVRYRSPRGIFVSWDRYDKKKERKMTEKEIEDVVSRVKEIHDVKAHRVSKKESVGRIRNVACVQQSQSCQGIQSTGSQSRSTIEQQDTRSYHASKAVPSVPNTKGMLPWEAFENTQPLRLLPPPQVTITNISTIPSPSVSTIPVPPHGNASTITPSLHGNASAVAPLANDKSSGKSESGKAVSDLKLEKIGRNGGLVLNL